MKWSIWSYGTVKNWIACFEKIKIDIQDHHTFLCQPLETSMQSSSLIIWNETNATAGK